MEVTEEFRDSFQCAHCGFATMVTIEATATGAAPNEADWEPETAARERAVQEAGTLAARTLMFAKCPRCTRRDPKAPGYRVQVLLGCLGLLAGVFALMFVLLMKGRFDRQLGDATPFVALALAIIAPVRMYMTKRRAWTRAHLVKFD